MLDIKKVVSSAFGFRHDLVLVQAVEGDGFRLLVHFMVKSVSNMRYIADLYIVEDKVTSAVLFIDR